MKMYSLFFRLLSSFLLITMIFIMIQFFVHNYYMNNMENHIIESNTVNLDYSSAKLKQICSQIENSLILLYSDKKMLGIKNYSDNNLSPYDIYVSQSVLSTFLANNYSANLYITDIFIYKEDYDMILSSSGGYDIEYFFNNIIKDMKYDAGFLASLYNSDFLFKYLPSYESENSFYMPICFKPNIPGSKLIFVAIIDIAGLIKSIDPTYDSNIMIFDDDTLIFSLKSFDELPGKVPETILKSDSNKIKFKESYIFKNNIGIQNLVMLKEVSIANIKQSINKINTTIIVLFILSIILSVILSVIFSVSIANPIRHLISFIKNSDSTYIKNCKINEVNIISKALESYMQTKTDQKDQTNEFVFNSFLRIAGIKKFYSTFSKINEKYVMNSKFRVICLTVNFKDNYSNISDSSDDTFPLFEYIGHLTETFDNYSLSFQLQNNRFITVVSCENDTANDFEKLLNTIITRMNSEKDFIDLTITVSNICSSAADLKNIIDEVIDAYTWRKLTVDFQVIYPEDQKYLDNNFIISEMQEMSLVNNFIAGNANECLTLIHNILNNNINKDVRLYHFRRLGIHIVNILIKCFNNHLSFDPPAWFSISDINLKINQCYTLDNYKKVLGELLQELILYIEENKKHEKQIVHNVNKYIEKHYADDISLSIVAEKLNLSSSYLSHFFKQATGSNFVDYLNQYRINKAKDMLLFSNDKIADIAAKVGYINQNSFSRTFKKYTGVTPSEYRSIHWADRNNASVQ